MRIPLSRWFSLFLKKKGIAIYPFVFILSAPDECAAAGDLAAGPAAPCGSVPILLPPSPRRARTHRNISPPPIRSSSISSRSKRLWRLASSRRVAAGAYEVKQSEGDARIASQLWAGGLARRCWRCSIRRWRRARRGCGSRAPPGATARRASRIGSERRAPTPSPSTLAGPAPWRTPPATRAPFSPGEPSLLLYCLG